MVGAGSSTGSAPGTFYNVAATASETDGETFDGDAEFDDYNNWDFAEVFSNLYAFSRWD